MFEATQDEICIASYLHDIGKFAQRAGIKEYYAKDMIGQILPSNKGIYSHYHALYTLGFLDHYAEADSFPDGINGQRIAVLAGYHHSPSSLDHTLIAAADRLSSGADRVPPASEDDIAYPGDSGRNQYKSMPLIHIPSEVRDSGTANKGLLSYVSLRPLEKKALVLTGTEPISSQKYRELWVLFEEDFQKCCKQNKHDAKAFILALDSLLERYTWCIPSSTLDIPDISLYQHAKTTAAFALVLYDFYKDKEDLSTEELLNTDVPVFRFVSGDASGIQKYIFNIQSDKNSTKLLRARSFQVWVQSFQFAQYIAAKAHCSIANIITFSGGRFLLLLSNTEKTIALLKMIREEIEAFCIDEYVGQLSFIISEGIAVSGKQLNFKNGNLIQGMIAQDGFDAKQKKFQSGLKKKGPVFSSVYENLVKNGSCPVCGLHPASLSVASSDFGEQSLSEITAGKGEELSEAGICPVCNALIRIGGQLVREGYDWLNIKWNAIEGIGKSLRIQRNSDMKANWHVFSINEYRPGYPRLYLPYLVPVDDDRVLTFEELAEEADGNQKIAMFKADIDNLGYVFMKDIPYWTISKYATLSQNLHFFFASYFQDFVEAHFNNKIYTVFSGGDDVCLIGAWNDIISFASKFHKEFLKFTNNNPELQISAGVALSSPHIPIAALAEMAEENLGQAKGTPGKNKISLFGRTMTWEQYDECLEDSVKIESFMNLDPKEAVSLGFVYSLLDLSDRALRARDKGSLRDALWMSNYRYSLARNIDKRNIAQRTFFEGFAVNPEKMERAKVSVSIALYKQRRAENAEL